MRDELQGRILNMLYARNIRDEDGAIGNELTIILNDYEIALRKTEVAIRSEDINKRLLERFLIGKTVKGCTRKTLQAYGDGIRRILRTINKPVPEITADDIRYYLAVRDRRDGINRVTQDTELRYMRSFFGYLHNEELIPKNPTAKIDRIKESKKKRRAFTETEVEKLRSGCANAKERMIVEVLLSTGCRVSELVGIRIEDIKDGKLIVHGKGEKDRVVYLNAKAELAIEQYIRERPDRNPYLLPQMLQVTGMRRERLQGAYRYKDNVCPDGHMSTSGIESTVRKIGRRAGVENVHPHRFRRTCATFALRRGMPIEQVSMMLGHEELSTTQIYLDIDERDLEQSHRKYVI